MKQILLICAAMVVLSCAKKEPEQEANVPDVNPPAQPLVKETKQSPAKPKVEPIKAKEYWEKAYAIRLKKLGPNHPDTKLVKSQLDALKE